MLKDMEALYKSDRNYSIGKYRTYNQYYSAAIGRSKGKCDLCGAVYKVVHHVTPLSNGGEHKMNNLVTLCEECHLKAHNGSYFGNNGLNEEIALSLKSLNKQRSPQTMEQILEYVRWLKSRAAPYVYAGTSKKSLYYHAGKFQAYDELIELLSEAME